MTDVPTIDDYLDAAAARYCKIYNLSKCTDRELCRRLGKSHMTVSAYRKRKAWPDDETMRRLAEAADMNVEAALAWLNVWRNQTSEPAVANVYANLARRLGRSAAVGMFCTLFAGSILAAVLGKPSHASGLGDAARALQSVQSTGPTLYIMENIRRRFRRVFSWIARPVVAAAIILATLIALPAAAAQPPAPADWQRAVGSLENQAAGGTLCTAVLVRADLIVTAAHCIAGARPAQLKFVSTAGDRRTPRAIIASGGHAGLRVDAFTARHDWALLSIDPLEATPIAVAPLGAWSIRKSIAAGAELLSAGYGLRVFRIHPRCAVGAVWGRTFFTTDCAVEVGDSGGPVLLVTGDKILLVGLNIGFDGKSALVLNAGIFAALIGT